MVKKLATIHYIAVASPDYLEQHGVITDPKSLANLPCAIHPIDPTWRFSVDNQLISVRAQQAFASNTYLVLRKAALNAIGAAMLPQQIVLSDLESGALVRLFPEIEVPERPLYAVFPPGGQPPKKVRVFMEFLAEHFKDNPIS